MCGYVLIVMQLAKAIKQQIIKKKFSNIHIMFSSHDHLVIYQHFSA